MELLQNPVPKESLLFDMLVVTRRLYSGLISELSQDEQPFHRHICWKQGQFLNIVDAWSYRNQYTNQKA